MTDHAVEPIDDTLLQQLRIQLGILVAGDDPDETKAGMFAVVCELTDRRARDTEVALMKDAGVRCELFCPECGFQHVDAPELESGWTNPPHRTHTCHACGNLWRPYPVATFGVLSEIPLTRMKDNLETATGVLLELVDAWEHGHWEDTGAKTINRYRVKIGRLADPELNNA